MVRPSSFALVTLSRSLPSTTIGANWGSFFAKDILSSRGVTTLTNAVSGQSQDCSGNLEISPGIGTLGIFFGKLAIIPGRCKKNQDIEGIFISSFYLG